MLQHQQLDNKNFVSPRNDIRIVGVKVSEVQRAEVVRRLSVDFPTVGDCQIINAGGQFRIHPLRGNQVPAGLTAMMVLDTIREVQADMPTVRSHGEPIWHINQRAYHARRGGR